MKLVRIYIFIVASFIVFSAHAAVDIKHWQTSEGAQVYFVENHDLPILDLSVTFPAGSARDTAEKSGLAGVTRYMMSLGAAGMNEEVITNKFADIGAVLGGSFDMDMAGYQLRTLSSEEDKALDTFKKILHQPDFPQAVLEREKARIISSLKESDTQPDSIAEKAFMKALYGSHPYSLDGAGEVDTISKINAEDLRAFYQKYYTAKSAVIALIGDMTEAQARNISQEIASGLPQTPAVEAIAKVQPLAKPALLEITHPATQAHILVGQPGIQRGDPDYFALYVGNYILGGGGFVSRLTEEVREKRGLVYSVYSYFMPMAGKGPFEIGLQTKKEQANEALKLVNETVANFVKNGVTDEELKAAKDNIIGGFPMRIDSNKKILSYLSVIGFYKLPLSYLDDFNKEIAKVTSKQINDAFKRKVNTDTFATIIVGAQ